MSIPNGLCCSVMSYYEDFAWFPLVGTRFIFLAIENFWKFVSMHQLKICVNASIKVESFLIMTVSDGGDPHAHSMINENYSLNLWSYLCHVCLFVSVSSDMGIPRGLPSAAQGIKLCQNWTTHASACHHQQPALCCISVNYAATDGDTHCGVVKYVSM